MKGYLYKEFKQNRLFLALTALLAVCVVFLPIILFMAEEKTMTREAFIVFAQTGIVFRVFCSMFGLMSAAAIQSLTLKGDDKKIWGYFVASNPKGIRGFIFTKYGFMLALSVIYFALCAGCDLVFVLMTRLIGGVSVPFMAEIYLYLFFSQLFICALDVPFTIRFGEKRGSYIKIIIMIVLLIIFIIVLLINPIAVEDIINNFFSNGEMPPFMDRILPIGSVIAFLLSAFISSKLYMKGVEQYYK